MDKYLGKRLDGRYIIKELIGVGGMAYVYKAYDSTDERTVALKILKDEFLENAEFTRRFKNESKAIAILSHPNIVKVYDVSFGESLQYIVMEYIDGITLKEYIDEQKDIKWKEAVHFTVQILRALQHAHDKGIVHRDIKPQNIMMLPDGTIKVMDFGIARLSRNDVCITEHTDKAIGSVHYISPEQARGDVTDEKSDIYSVGVMLYEMLAGKLPFDGENAVSVAIMQLQSEATPLNEVNPDAPEGLVEITMKAMQKDPAKRYQTAAEMLYDIDEFKRNPSIHFEYKYMVDEPTRHVSNVKAKDDDDEDEEPRKTPIFGILAIVACAVVLAAIVLVVVIFSGKLFPNGGKDEILVDRFIGLDYVTEVMTNDEFNNNYTFNDLQYEYNGQYPAGTVIKQDPPANTKVKKKSTLTLTISKGSRLQQVDDVTNLHYTDAAALLTSSGFVTTTAQQASDTVPEGFVIKTVPAAKAQAEYGSKVTIFVSSGATQPDPIEMIDVKGLSEIDATNALIDAGFTVGSITYRNGDYLADQVLEQSTNPEELYIPGYAVDLVISSGYRDVTLKVDLPYISTAIDVRVYIDGDFDEDLSNKYINIIPKYKGKAEFPLVSKKSSYTVAVHLSVAGTDKWQECYLYQINAVNGTYSLLEEHDFQTSATTTTPTTTPTTAPTEPQEDTEPATVTEEPEE